MMDLLAPVFAAAWFEHVAIFAVVWVVVMVAFAFSSMAIEAWGWVNLDFMALDFFMYLALLCWWLWLSYGWLMEYLS